MTQSTETRDGHGNLISEELVQSAPSSVEIRQDAKGNPLVTVKIYGENGAIAAYEALQVYWHTIRDLREDSTPSESSIKKIAACKREHGK